MFSDPTLASWQFILMLIGGCFVLFSTAAFVIIGSFLMGAGKWHITAFVMLIAILVLWTFVQHTLNINLRPFGANFGG
ncbi:hypothetical protein [uncultured Shimia sp.]|uniref:hypothetical protein n=1 Tax=uncultured Shimia sp. TaxID=573152 RepID=UPI0025E4816D|nr:hypothetical protein [uncultured Shimia sp.]